MSELAPEQVKQLESQVGQAEADRNLPSSQLKHSLNKPPEQLKQFKSHYMHWLLADLYKPSYFTLNKFVVYFTSQSFTQSAFNKYKSSPQERHKSVFSGSHVKQF